ncbi:Hypp3795 [Branchiostoma lanceolatum]|uniref:Hypp3795 protein n=1 Tax=Branchiostoma lanceolatum TaxID=7740 RepID=A0A8K0A7K6_BRALA|nr:Hypp3795 [Branchiostoma lanceolatum]
MFSSVNSDSHPAVMSYNGSCVLGLGVTFIVLGSLSLILGIAANAAFDSDYHFTFHKIGAPIWSGILVIITGIIGVFSGKSPTNKGLMAAFLPFSIFVILLCFACVGLSATGIAVDGESCGGGCAAIRALHGVCLLLALTEVVLGFVSSIMSCVGMCSSNHIQPTVIYHQAAPMYPGGVVFMQNTSAGGYPMHPSGMTYVGGGVQSPVVFQPQPTAAPPAYPYGMASGPINPTMVVHTQSNI